MAPCQSARTDFQSGCPLYQSDHRFVHHTPLAVIYAVANEDPSGRTRAYMEPQAQNRTRRADVIGPIGMTFRPIYASINKAV